MNTLTFLAPAHGQPARKVHRWVEMGAVRLLKTDSYGQAVQFTHCAEWFGDIEHVLAVLLRQSARNAFLIRGTVRPDAPKVIQRTLKKGENPFILDTPSLVIPVDLDREIAPDGLDTSDILAVGDYLRSRLPLELQDVSCVVQLSAGYGLWNYRPAPKHLKARLWFLNDQALTGAELRRWFKAHNKRGGCALMDAAVATPSQPIYTAAPLFEGMIDPVPTRLALLLGERDAASVRPPVQQLAPAPAPGNGGVRCPAVLTAATRLITQARDGEKHTALNTAAYLAGGYVGGGACTREEARAALRAAIAAKSNVVDLDSAYQTIENGLLDGERAPLYVPAPVQARLLPTDQPEVAPNPTVVAAIAVGKCSYQQALGVVAKANAVDVVPAALAVVKRFVWQSPVHRSFADLQADLLKASGPHSPRVAPHIARLTNWLENQARLRAVATSRLDRAALKKKGLGVEDAADFPAALAMMRPGHLVLLKAPIGSGKTEKFLKALAVTEKTVAITTRVSLVADLANRLAVDSYKSPLNFDHCDRLAICLNSIGNGRFSAPLENAQAVLIDEISAVCRECHAPQGTLRKQAKNIWQKLCRLLSTAEIAAGVDADLCTDDVLALAADVERPLQIIEVAATLPQIAAEIGAMDAVLAQALAAIKEGIPTRIFSDSARQIAKLDALIRERHPDLRVMAIHAKNGIATTGRPDVLAALDDINAAMQGYDVLLHTPCVESGLSITQPYFDATYGFYAGMVSPAAFIQMARRDRTASRIVVGVIGTGLRQLEERPGAILGNLEAVHRRTVELANATGDGSYLQKITPATPWDARVCQYAAVNARTLNRYAADLWHLLEARGATVAGLGAMDLTGVDEAMAAAADLQRAAYRNALRAAPDISASQRESIESAYAASPAESAMADRYDLQQTLAVRAVSDDALDEWDEGGIRSKARRFAALTVSDGGLIADTLDDRGGVAMAAREHRLAVDEAVLTAFEVLGFDPATGSGDLDANSAEDAYKNLLASPVRPALEHAGLLNFRNPPRDTVRWAGHFLRRLGLSLTMTGKRGQRGKQHRCYRIAPGETWDSAHRRMVAPGWVRMSAIMHRRLVGSCAPMSFEFKPEVATAA